MINPQSHSAHSFCQLHEYIAHKVQESRGITITLRNYNTKTTNCITCIVKSVKQGSGSQTTGGRSRVRGGGAEIPRDPLNLTLVGRNTELSTLSNALYNSNGPLGEMRFCCPH